MDSMWAVTLFVITTFGSGVAVVVLLLILGPTQYNPYRPGLIQEQSQQDGGTFTALKNEGKDSYGRFSQGRNTTKKLNSETTVQVVVLGDIGRSPRMQYHAKSLVEQGVRVQLVGYQESDLLPELVQHPLLQVVPLSPPPRFLRDGPLPFVVKGPLKALHQAWDLYQALAYRTPATKFMLVQNPPAVPVLAVAQMVCFQRNTRLVVDWHNYGWSILALKLGKSHPLVFISRIYESVFSRGADAHLTVTDAMARDVATRVSVRPRALHDRPAAAFRPISPAERSEALAYLEPSSQYAADLLKGSWKLLVSSTSWTADEDFSVLLHALVEYSAGKKSVSKLPNLLVIITGKGPQKEHYLREIAKLNQDRKLEHVVIQTAWLSMKDYAQLLASADLGVCLHQSSSGLDLPMKIVDMFGAGLPVLAWSKYESFGELVKEGQNGRGFESAEALQQLLVELLAQDGSQLRALKEGAVQESHRRWNDEWDAVAGVLFGVHSEKALK
ncbi:hypothetical protein FH972_023246 [Carpinus fangiana]|uniref:Glycosyltransferase subfamily 4-like N-terminal domain-containing protein n=1 Tax=Carpinus fangiana TaxID=176857 RepID=A0A5N6KUZ5_9ROSI|nr:hypothetical protein FH972_023246 [Carpinus fangiana]